MNQAEKREYLIRRLLYEDRRYGGVEVPASAGEQKRMLRSLMNIRRPQAIDAEFLNVQDEYLRQEIEDAGITRLADLEPICGDFYLWQGDITRLECGAIVNAANSGMTGCYVPCHACIGCKLCYSKCPQKCIDISGKPVVIQQQNCLHCGNCYEICPARAIVKRG